MTYQLVLSQKPDVPGNKVSSPVCLHRGHSNGFAGFSCKNRRLIGRMCTWILPIKRPCYYGEDMPIRSESRRGLKKKVFELLKLESLDRALEAINGLPAARVINALFSLLHSTDPRLRWAAVNVFGSVVSRLANQDMEQARVIMRRLMWQLNNESGGIGWGCPESMGETMACHEGLANEFAHILVSYVRKDGNFLEYEPLQQAVVWGIARLAEVRPQLVREAVPHLLPFLEVRNATLRGLAAWALGMLGAKAARSEINSLVHDTAAIEIFVNRQIMRCQVGELARQAIVRVDRT